MGRGRTWSMPFWLMIVVVCGGGWLAVKVVEFFVEVVSRVSEFLSRPFALAGVGVLFALWCCLAISFWGMRRAFGTAWPKKIGSDASKGVAVRRRQVDVGCRNEVTKNTDVKEMLYRMTAVEDGSGSEGVIDVVGVVESFDGSPSGCPTGGGAEVNGAAPSLLLRRGGLAWPLGIASHGAGVPTVGFSGASERSAMPLRKAAAIDGANLEGALKTNVTSIRSVAEILADSRNTSRAWMKERFPDMAASMQARWDLEDERERRGCIVIPYESRGRAKGLGAKWDQDLKSWFIPDGVAPGPLKELERTIRLESQILAGCFIEIDVSYDEKDDAKDLGARWNGKSWYVPAGVDLVPFRPWWRGGAIRPEIELRDGLGKIVRPAVIA